MKKASIKVNFIMNSLLSISSFLFPMITFPYISRVLLASGTGRINFATSIVNYVLTLSMLGIPLYGVKACAVDRKDRKKLSQTVLELLVLNGIAGGAGLLVLLGATLLVKEFRAQWELIAVMSLLVPLNIIGAEWFYRGMEEYTYISLRNMGFKLIGVLLMFLLVHDEQDVLAYGGILVLAGAGSYLLNFIRLRRYVRFGGLQRLDLKRHIRPVLSFFVLSVSWTIYTNTDVIMLGMLQGETAVGYYSASLRIKAIILGIVSALSGVLLPRVVHFFAEKRYEEAVGMIRKNASFVLLSSLYFIGFIITNAREVILLLAGKGYLPAIPVIQVTILMVLLVGYSSLLGTNVLISLGRERITILASFVGIGVNVILNAYLIPRYSALGAGVATVVGECSMILCEVVCIGKEIRTYFDRGNCKKTLLAFLVSAAAVLLLKGGLSGFLSERQEIWRLLVYLLLAGSCYTFLYLALLYRLREEMVWNQGRRLLKKLRKKERKHR